MRYLFAIIVLALIGFTIATASKSGADQPEIVGIERAELEREGIHFGPPANGAPKVTPADAIKAAQGQGTIRQTVLANLDSQNVAPKGKRDVWVINYDPATVKPISSGPIPEPGKPRLVPVITIALAFVDAQTGEFLYSINAGTTEEE